MHARQILLRTKLEEFKDIYASCLLISAKFSKKLPLLNLQKYVLNVELRRRECRLFVTWKYVSMSVLISDISG